MVKTERDNDVTKWQFSIDFCEKCHVGDGTVATGESYSLPVFFR